LIDKFIDKLDNLFDKLIDLTHFYYIQKVILILWDT